MHNLWKLWKHPCYQYISRYKTDYHIVTSVEQEKFIFKADKIQSLGVNGMNDSLFCFLIS